MRGRLPADQPMGGGGGGRLLRSSSTTTAIMATMATMLRVVMVSLPAALQDERPSTFLHCR
jgi:hypothetical protein